MIEPPIDLPERIGDVRLGRVLSNGGGRTVVAGVDPSRDAPVAVTIVDEPGEEARRRILDSVRTLRAIDSDRVARIYDAGELDAGRLYLIGEMIGDRVADRIAARGGRPMPVAHAFAMAVAAAECLADAHGHGIFFRAPDAGSFRFAASGAGERIVVDDIDIVPMSRRLAASPADERDAIVSVAANLFAELTRDASPDSGVGSSPGAVGAVGGDHAAGIDAMVAARIAASLAGPPAHSAEPVAFDGAPVADVPVADVPAAPEMPTVPVVIGADPLDARPATQAATAGSAVRRPAFVVLASVLAAGLLAGAGIGWVATGGSRAEPKAPAAAPRPQGSGPGVGGTAPASSPAAPASAKASASGASTPPPGASAGASAGASTGATSGAASGAGSASPASADDPQGRAGRYSGFITATNDGCGALRQGRNDRLIVDVDVDNRGRAARLTFRIEDRDPISINVTLAESGAFRGDYNIDGTSGKTSGRFAGARIADVTGSEGDCEYAWSAKRT